MTSTQLQPQQKAVQDSWRQPKSTTEVPTIKVYNSLTRTKVDFVTKKPGIISWYNCGPTVYDASHMGHARNYLTQDIMRRILRDYFGYEINFVMNITDVDDKIIIRGRQFYLLANYLTTITSSPTPLSPTLLTEIQSVWTTHFYKTLSTSIFPPVSPSATSTYSEAVESWKSIKSQFASDPIWAEKQKLSNEKWSMNFNAVQAGFEGILLAEQNLKSGKTGAEEATSLVESNNDAVAAWLDKKLGSTVSDPMIFRNLASKWELSFFNSMEKLHVERPTTLTRVSEYIPEIVSFVEEIVKKGLAYEGGGSIWFDTGKFDGAEMDGIEGGGVFGEGCWKHTYAKLQPWSKGNRELIDDGEGALSDASGKRFPSDFGLWKASKPGEPAWDSPWGLGRPGWHIECSVMATAVLGKGMDIHSGGVDLAFPHHDNEIAQSEAYHGCQQWVNYFFHTGHLHIEGLKMSKSLKNFITIDDALTRFSARKLRYAFLCQTWNSKFDFKESAMQEVKSAEMALNNFFSVVNALVSEFNLDIVASDGKNHFDTAELSLLQSLEDAQTSFRLALSDSFDTPKALTIILDLVSLANVYSKRGRGKVNVMALVAVSEWVTRMLRMFGLGEGNPIDSKGEKVIGWGVEKVEGGVGEEGSDREPILMPYLRAMSTFRDKVRQLAISGGSAADILALSDQLRDLEMVDLGVALDDQEDGKALVKLVPTEQLQAARAEKENLAAEKLARKAESLALIESKRLEKLEKGRLPPQELFKSNSSYSEFDENGIPGKESVSVEGQQGTVVEIAKSKKKKLIREWDLQKKLHDEFLKSLH